MAATSRLIQSAPEVREHSGDAVLLNERMALVFRLGATGVEVFGRSLQTPETHYSELSPRAVLSPGGGPGTPRLTSFSIATKTSSGVAIDAHFDFVDGSVELDAAECSDDTIDGSVHLTAMSSVCIRYTLPEGQCHVVTEPIAGVHALSIESPCRFVVQPDFFADDIVLDATNISTDTARLTSENFLLHLSPDRNAIVMTFSEVGDQDASERENCARVDGEIRLKLSGSDHNRLINGCEISFGTNRRIFVALLEAPGIWHHRDVEKNESGEIVSLEWTAPFSAQWRVDWQAADKLTKSWRMIAEREDGQFQRHSMWRTNSGTVAADRKCWATYLRDYLHPCWLDTAGRGYLQPLSKPVAFEGAAIVYPIGRLTSTPRDASCVIDVAMAALGADGCKKVLDVAGQMASLKGVATCSARDTLTPIYAANQEKERRPQIQLVLNDVLAFVRSIRGRIEEYSRFGREMLAYLQDQRQTNEQSGEAFAVFLSEMEELTRVIDEKVAQKLDLIGSPQYADELVAEFRKNLVNGDEPSSLDCLSECQRIMDAIVVVGGNQDELLGQCRAAVKALRQRAGIAMIDDANSSLVVCEIRKRTKRILRNPAVHEFPRY